MLEEPTIWMKALVLELRIIELDSMMFVLHTVDHVVQYFYGERVRSMMAS